MFKKVYDQIYDAHIFIFSLHSVKTIFNEYNFDLVDAIPHQLMWFNAYIISRKGHRNISNRVKKLFNREKEMKLNTLSACLSFKKKCENSKKNFRKKYFD